MFCKRKKVANAPLPSEVLSLALGFLTVEECAVARSVCRLFSTARAARAVLKWPKNFERDVGACIASRVTTLHVNEPDFSLLTTLRNLHTVTLSKCCAHDLQPLGACNLTNLTLDDMPNLRSLKSLERCTSLERLTVKVCCGIETFEGVNLLPCLENLTVLWCYSLWSLKGLAGAQIKDLDLDHCYLLKDVSELASVPNLERLSFTSCYAVTDFSSLERCAALKELSVHICPGLVRLPVVLTLTTLEVTNCCNLESAKGLDQCVKLRVLTLGQCGPVTTLEGICEHVEKLDLADSSFLQDTSPLSVCKKLKVLDLQGCTSLTDLDGLHGCTRLKTLDLTDCLSLETLCGLSTCANLQTVNLRGCSKLQFVTALARCKRLKFVDARDTDALNFAHVEEHLAHVDQVLV